MPLSVGDKLGHYEVLSLLGAGGMGQVYRAKDTKLDRQVAIKVLPSALAREPERLARFEREAKVLASLDHPNIGHIYGLVDSEDSNALVLGLIEGPTLADRIAIGPLPLDDALSIAKQIIEALEYAHDRGVVHRDLKPANIKITPEGVVKVLDFGLAKVLEDEPPPPSLSNSPTLTLGHTRAGMILGTAAYMSPEQAIGRPVDRRSDIFSFGAVLFEMLTGKRAFKGAATPDVLEAVVKFDPDWAALPPGTPAYLRRLLERTLAKDRKQRLQAIGEARIVLSNPAQEAVGQVPGLPTRKVGLLWPSAAALLAVTTALALWAPWRSATRVDRPLVRLDVDLGADVSLPSPVPGGTSVVLSPDGTRLAYTSGLPVKLFTRRLDQPKSSELPGTQGAEAPFFSPDGQWIGFIAEGKLNKISVEGGAVVPLGNPAFTGASWGEDGGILVGQADNNGLVRIPAGGGPPEVVARLGKGEIAFSQPHILPGGKAVLLAVTNSIDGESIIEVLTLADGRRKVLVASGKSPRYIPAADGAGTGHLVYINKSTLFAIPFDVDKLQTGGTAVPVLNDVGYEERYGGGQLDLSGAPSGHGTLVYRQAGRGTYIAAGVQWVDPTGRREALRIKPGVYQFPSVSPDGKRVALTVGGGAPDVWVYDQQRDAMTRVTFGGGANAFATWSPDGQYIVFSSYGRGIFQARADGASQPQALLAGTQLAFLSFAPDGKRLAYMDLTGSRSQIWTAPLENQGNQLKAGKPEQFLQSSSSDQFPSFSPDGRWLAYHSTESGPNEVYVRAFPSPSSGQGGKWQISNSGGTVPRWSRNGHELMYQSGDQIMAASYTVKGDTFVAEKSRVWIAKLGGSQWDLSADGKRVVVVTPVESAEAPKEHEVVFLENFFDELRRKVPPGK
jgi:serine/threonine protein kinase/Tol biopolymer transport system component